MKKIDQYILEKFVINKNSKSIHKKNLTRDDLNQNLVYDIYYHNTVKSAMSNKKFMNYHKNNGDNIIKLIKTFKQDRLKLCKRFMMSIEMGWYDFAKEARNIIIEQGYYTKEEIQDFLDYLYNNYTNTNIIQFDDNKTKNIIDTLDKLINY